MNVTNLNNPNLVQQKNALSRNRHRIRQILNDYKEWARRHAQENDVEEKRYLNYEGMFLRNHFRDGWALYRMVSHEYHQSCKGVNSNQVTNKRAA